MRAGLLFRFAAAGILAFAASHSQARDATVEKMTVEATPLREFRIGSDQRRFGPFEFVGGLVMTASSSDFGGLSSFRFRSPGGDFIGVADTGLWYFGHVAHDRQGRPSGFEDFRMAPITDDEGSTARDKWKTDSEAIAIKGDIATVGFEREHRIAEFRIDPQAMGRALRNLDFLVPRKELRANKGFETVAYSLDDGPLAGARIAIAERSIDEAGNCFAAILEGPEKGIFKVARHDDFDITDGAFLPDGDLLVLERRYKVLSGVAMRLRRIPVSEIHPGATADGSILMTADMGYQIDNMEGLDVWKRADGATMISLISDDNQSFLERNLYLEFRLDG